MDRFCDGPLDTHRAFAVARRPDLVSVDCVGLPEYDAVSAVVLVARGRTAWGDVAERLKAAVC